MKADCDGDRIRDIDEEVGCVLKADCDNDTIRDIDEEAGCILKADCDNDTVGDADEEAGCILKADCDNDTVSDGDEEAGCILEVDCDMDEVGDAADNCPVVANRDQRNTDGVADGGDACDDDDDNDNVMDSEDLDSDGDGLIEIGTEAELNAVRYALNGSGRKLSADVALNTSGCGDGSGITSCKGYELVADISLAAYKDGAGWQPLGGDKTSTVDGCQGEAFNGTFEGNGFVISDLSINRSDEDCVGLFGHIASGSVIANLTLLAERVRGGSLTGALVGDGEGSRIISSSVVAGEVSGADRVGGLMGGGKFARIVYSSVVAGKVSGRGGIGGLVGHSSETLTGGVQIISSSVVVGEVSGGSNDVGGLVGYGWGARIISSSAVVGEASVGVSRAGGLMGFGILMKRRVVY